MKLRKLISGLFGLTGALLMIAATVLCLTSLDAPPQLEEVPAPVRQLVERFAQAMNSGDPEALSQTIYGTPALSLEAENPDTDPVWQFYLSHLRCTPASEPYATDSGICWDVSVEAPSLSELTDAWASRARFSSADSVDAALSGTLEAALSDLGQTRRSLTLELVNADGSWWIRGNDALLALLSGRE